MSPGLNRDGFMREMAAVLRRANVYRLAAVAIASRRSPMTRIIQIGPPRQRGSIRYPQYRDPLRYWEDCEKNIENWVEP
ncbi:MAG: hypothetical protein QOC89_5774 [Paraburkholderia sp.]|nr:hypothetical protein [Paraburkholderia sp.]